MCSSDSQRARPDQDAERLTAFHEAGHAVMAEICGQHITMVEIEGDSEHSGSVESLRFQPDPNEILDEAAAEDAIRARIKCVLAGPVAESMVSGRADWPDSSEDLDNAVRLAMPLVENCEKVLPLLEQLRDEIIVDLDLQWAGVERLAEELLGKKALDGAEVRRLLTTAR